jgi:hypothetical protein
MHASHPWHDLEIGENAPKEVMAVIEIPAKSKVPCLPLGMSVVRCLVTGWGHAFVSCKRELSLHLNI